MIRRLCIIAIVTAIVLPVAYFYGPAGVQRREIRAAEKFQQHLVPILAADKRFSAITLTVSTRPALLVFGMVPDEKALIDLTALCQPPKDAGFGLGMQAYPDPEWVATSRPAQ